MNDRPGTAPATATAPALAPAPATARADLDEYGQIVLVLQGGGALGAYQGGVFDALTRSGITPDWVIGTSIGAFNAAIIAGNPPERRMERLLAFWRIVRQGPLAQWAAAMPAMFPFAPFCTPAATTALTGVPGMFEPNPAAWFGMQWPLGAEAAGLYGCAPLRRTLAGLIDLDILNTGPVRLTVGAANVRTGQMHYFDTSRETLTLDHIMASGALPPAFPAIRIEGELYWDGGVLSNTPVEAVFDDNPRRSGIVFSVHVWNPQGEEPDTIWKVMSREKDLRYASRTGAHIERQRQIHRLRHVITNLAQTLPDDIRNRPEVKALTAYGCVTRMHVVRLLAPALYGEDHSRDIDFSAAGIRQRWQAGSADTTRVLEKAPWTHAPDPLEGFILHEAMSGEAAA